MQPAQRKNADRPKGSSKKARRWLAKCFHRAVNRFRDIIQLVSEFVTAKALLTSVIIAVVLPTILWWIV